MTTPSREDINSRLDPPSVRHAEVQERAFGPGELDIPPGASTQDLLRILIQQTHQLGQLWAQAPAWLVTVVTVETAGEPKQGPNQPIPAGYKLVVRVRDPGGGVSPTGRVSYQASAITSTQSRSELPKNATLELRVDNMNKVWVDADTANTAFEFITEQV